jgi:tetratricopeptide (TPR) repeat protein
MSGPEPGEIAVPETIAQYRVGKKLGEGGMGVVFAARDEVLEREVAVKLLRFDRSDARAKERMLREARTLAKLSHPNIVPIYGAGEEGGLVYLAMELVSGRSFRDVRDDDALDWAARLHLYLQAGRGLAAAHAADVVHRDFKPSNVLVGEDGRVRVLDFGLARSGTATAEGGATSPGSRGSHTDAMAGTPAYMAPEQRVGDPADARADQYSFCVALWEALFGANPIRKTPLTEVIDGELLAEVPRGTQVPTRISDALRTGFRREPARRHPSMQALLDALELPASRARWGTWLGLAGALAVGVGAWAMSGDEPCTGVEGAFAQVYGAEQRTALDGRLTQAELPDAQRERVLAALDRHAEQWTQTRRSTCQAHARGETSAGRYDTQSACLDARAAEVAAVLSLEHGVPTAVAALRAPQGCADPAALGSGEPPPPGPGGEAARKEIRSRVARAHAFRNALDLAAFDEALRGLEADVSDDVPMQAEVVYARGEYLRLRGQWIQAADAFERAYTLAEQSGHASAAAQAAVRLILVLGDRLARRAEADVWTRVAETKLQSMPDPGLRADLALAKGSVALTHADFDTAEAQLQDALRRTEAHWGAEHPKAAVVHEALGALAHDRSDAKAAKAAYATVLEIRERAFGLQHPLVADAHFNLANVDRVLGELDAAEAGFRRGLEMLDATDPNVGTSRAQMLLALAEVDTDRGHVDNARASYRRALASMPDGTEHHPVRATILASFAALESREGADARSVEMATEALEIQERAFGAKHPTLAVTLNGLGTSLQAVERLEEAKRALQRAVDIHREVHGPRSAAVAPPLSNLALIEHEQDNSEVARGMLEEVLSIEVEALGAKHPNVVFDHYYLAMIARSDKRYQDALDHLAQADAIEHPSIAVQAEVKYATLQTKAEAELPWRDDVPAVRKVIEASGVPDGTKAFDAWVAAQP